MLAVGATASLLAVQGCSGKSTGGTERDNASAPSFILWGVSSSCLVAKAKKPTLKLCVTGQGDLESAKDKTKRAVELWLEPLRSKFEGVTTNVEMDCNDPDGTVSVSLGDGTAMAGPGHANIFDQSAFGTVLHEFGHAFACIGDTYSGGVAGWCQAGQPHSIMCDGLLRNDLADDDITAVRQQFASYFGVAGGDDDTGGGDLGPDSDGDGVADGLDRCPATPAGSTVWRDQQGGQWRGCASGQTPTL